MLHKPANCLRITEEATMIKDIITANENVAPNSREMAVLKENFPSCFHTDGTFDIERFKKFLGDK